MSQSTTCGCCCLAALMPSWPVCASPTHENRRRARRRDFPFNLGRTVRAGFFCAIGVQREGVAVQLEAARAGHIVLPALYVGVVELFDPPALQADQVVVVSALVQL